MDDNPFFRAISEGGYGWAYLTAFGYGILTSLTPCVYPMIGITVSIFGARQVERRIDGFILSCCFVLGMAVMFSTAGLVAGVGGLVFGSLLANPWVVGGIAVMLAALALSMFGVWEFRLPASWQNRLAGVGGAGRVGAFLMGLPVGIVAAPCTGPFLLGILTYVGTTGSPVLGFTLLLAYALGMGLLFLIIGTFAVSLPKSGAWMDAVKTFLGAILLATAGYFLIIPLPALGELFRSGWSYVLAAAALVVAGTFGGGLGLPWRGGGGLRVARKIAGIAAVSGGLFGVASSLTYAEPLDWIDGIAAAEAKAEAEKRPLLVDFTARWCSNCKKIEREVLSAPDVRPTLGNVVLGRVDLSNDDEAAEGGTFEIRGRRFTLRGLPRLLLIDAEGVLVRDWGGDLAPPSTPGEILNALREIGVAE